MIETINLFKSCLNCEHVGYDDSAPGEYEPTERGWRSLNISTTCCALDGSDIPEECICSKYAFNFALYRNKTYSYREHDYLKSRSNNVTKV